jgi:hypothetical protein
MALIDTDLLSDTSILNQPQMLVEEQQVPFDLVFGRFSMVVYPNNGISLRQQLSTAIQPHTARLVARKLINGS